MRDRLRLTFSPEGVPEPVVCTMAKKFDVVFSIRRANVEATNGWMDLELQGEDPEIERAIKWLEEQGVQVSPVGGDVIEG
jgi:ABC-type methionine transport system ATPase subunit